VSSDYQVPAPTNLLLCTENKAMPSKPESLSTAFPPRTPPKPPALSSFACITASLSTETLCRSLRLCALYRHNVCHFLINRIGETLLEKDADIEGISK
jgi:hypothetical protein